MLFVRLFLFALVRFLSVSSSSWCLGRAAVCDCGTPWTFLLPLFYFLEEFPSSVNVFVAQKSFKIVYNPW